MNRTTLNAASVALCVALGLGHVYAAGSADLPVGHDRSSQAIPGQYIVVLNEHGPLAALGAATAAQSLLGSVGGGDLLTVYEHALLGFAARLNPLQADLIARMPGVRLVEADQTMHVVATQNNATWGLDRIDQRTRPLDGKYTYPDSAGDGVNVYIIDTGLRATHTEFSGRVGGGRNFVGGGLLGLGSVDPNNWADCNGHGTHVAGTATGTVYGVAKQATVYGVRVLDCQGSGTNSGVINGVDWVAGNHVKPAVANLSLGGGNSTSLDDAVRNLIAAGVTVAVAAGNDNANACSGSPNRVAEALTVGSTTSSDARSSFSNFGSCVDLFAPGSSITSAWHQNDTQTNTISGTSMAAPHVAGAAALVLGKQPTATPDDVAAVLLADATLGVLTGIGSGSPNLLLYVDPTDSGTPVDRLPTASFTFVCSDLDCTFDGSGSSDDHGISGYAWNFGDGLSGSGVSVAHSYVGDGSYTVTLTVTDSIGQTASSSQTVSVTAPGSGPCSGCTKYEGSLSGSGAQNYHPSASGFSFGGGTIRGYLRGPSNADFDLYLERYGCGLLGCSWSTVARGESADSDEDISYNAASGSYRWRVRSYSGSGSYALWGDPQ